jgi:hypothetical protein
MPAAVNEKNASTARVHFAPEIALNSHYIVV